MTFEFIVGRTIAHGVIEANLLARLDGAHGDQADLPGKTHIRIAGMIEQSEVSMEGDIK